MHITLENAPQAADVQALRAALAAYNIAQEPALHALPQGEWAIVARDAAHTLIGGAVGEFDMGWLYVDVLWVSAAARGQGLGGAIMHAVENLALQHGAKGIWLITSSFQAPVFYQKLGYEQWSAHQDRPHGHTTYYFRKTALKAHPIPDYLHIQIPPDADDWQALDAQLRDHSAPTAPIVVDKLAAFLHDEAGTVRGGIFGGTYWDWFDLRYLWVDEALRGRGYGTQLLHIAESECRKRGVIGITCDTIDYQALPFYQAHNFNAFGTLAHRPPQHISYFLLKHLR